MSQRGFTLIELLVVVAVIAVLAAIMLVSVGRATDQARLVRTQAQIDDFKVGVEKYIGAVHKYPFVADAAGDFNVDDCWRELAPLTPGLTAGRQPGDVGFRNRSTVECLSLNREQLADTGDGKLHVVDAWSRSFCMQWDWFHKKTMIWSAGEDRVYDISDVAAMGGHSSLFATQAQAQTGSPPAILEADLENRIRRDVSNH